MMSCEFNRCFSILFHLADILEPDLLMSKMHCLILLPADATRAQNTLTMQGI